MKTRRGIFEKVVGSDIWWIRFVDASGRYRREKAGSWAQAKKLLTKRQNEALAGRKLPETLRRKFVGFGEIADNALEYSKANKSDYRSDKSRMKTLKEWWGNRDAESLTTAEIEARFSEAERQEGWAPSTCNHYRALVMLIYREARRSEKVATTVNPARDVRHRHEDNNRLKFLSPAEEDHLRKAITEKYAEHLPEFEFALSTGLRKGSMYGLTWSMVDWDGRMLNIPTSKNGEPLHIPLNERALAALRTVYQRGDKSGRVFESKKTGQPLADSRHWFKTALTDAKIAGFRWHDLRHTFASRLRVKGAKLADIGELLGHKGLAMTKRYAHLGPNQLHDVTALLDSNSTPVAPAASENAPAPVRYVN